MDWLTFAIIAGGLVVMKSKASPLTPMPSLSTMNSGRLPGGSVKGKFSWVLSSSAHSRAGITGDKSAPVVVVPVDPLPTYI